MNNLLLDALRAAIRHQVGEQESADAFQSIDAFAQAEARRWELVRAGNPPPRVVTPEERIDELVGAGYQLQRTKQPMAACDRWLEAWEIVKQLAKSEFRTAFALEDAYEPMGHCLADWTVDRNSHAQRP